MNLQWPAPTDRRQTDAAATGRAVSGGRMDLAFDRHGQRTHIGRQFVSYPMHMTRPFLLDAAIPSLLTVYQQSCSGGLYRADRLSSRFDLGAQAAAHVTTQAATVVHDCHGLPARQDVEVLLDEGAYLALTPDPLVLFPGASCDSTLTARLAPGAVLLLTDAFASHDPKEESRSFERLNSQVRIEDETGRLLVRDRFQIYGKELSGPSSPAGDWKVVANFMLLGDASRLPPQDLLTQTTQGANAVCGVTALPNGAGWGVRCLAADAVSARGLSERLFALSVEAAFGASPAPRRK